MSCNRYFYLFPELYYNKFLVSLTAFQYLILKQKRIKKCSRKDKKKLVITIYWILLFIFNRFWFISVHNNRVLIRLFLGHIRQLPITSFPQKRLEALFQTSSFFPFSFPPLHLFYLEIIQLKFFQVWMSFLFLRTRVL